MFQPIERPIIIVIASCRCRCVVVVIYWHGKCRHVEFNYVDTNIKLNLSQVNRIQCVLQYIRVSLCMRVSWFCALNVLKQILNAQWNKRAYTHSNLNWNRNKSEQWKLNWKKHTETEQERGREKHRFIQIKITYVDGVRTHKVSNKWERKREKIDWRTMMIRNWRNNVSVSFAQNKIRTKKKLYARIYSKSRT